MSNSSNHNDNDETASNVFKAWQVSCLVPGASMDARRDQAYAYFETICTSGMAEATNNPSADALLAQLVQALGPAMMTTMEARVAALSCLEGALRACQEAEGTTVVISCKVTELLGTFLLQHCGPMQEDDDSLEDFDEQVRDSAVSGLGHLIACACPSTTTTTTNAAAAEEQEDVVALYRIRLHLAKSGVERRCAAPELQEEEQDMDQVEYYERGAASKPIITSGLSTLPRSRRSLCFGLLQSAVDSIARLSRTHDLQHEKKSALAPELVSFANFVYQCLHGESDPRCLLQLLQLLHSVLITWHALLRDLSSFPLAEFFDAVAPYYPILFTPPPNDTNGISRAGLRNALMSVLTCSRYDAAARNASRETMVNMSLGLVVERLVPPPDDGPATWLDQQEGLEDLVAILTTDDDNKKNDNVFALLQVPEMRQVSETLQIVHEEASTAVVMGGPEADRAKNVADQCRSVLATMARSVEPHPLLWKVLVADAVQSLALQLSSSSSSKGRMAIAYIACLAASGGPKTLRASLSAGLTPLLQNLSLDKNNNKEKEAEIVTAAHGLGALFASCRAALARKEGVVMHPHPLLPYTAKAVAKICALLSLDDHQAVSLAIKRSAVCALESVVVASPSSLFSPEEVAQLSHVIRTLSQAVLTSVAAEAQTETDTDVTEWASACSRTLGGFLGTALGTKDETAMTTTIVQEQELAAFLRGEVFSKLLDAAMACEKVPPQDNNPIQCARATLALAGTFSLAAATEIVRPVVQALCKGLAEEDFAMARGPAQALSFFCKERGSHVPRAFQDAVADGSFNIVEELTCFEPIRGENKGLEARFGMSNLELPPSTEDRDRVDAAVTKAYTVIPLLLPAYSVPAASSHLKSLASCIDRVIPPLTDSDTVQASVALPFLSAALAHAIDPADSVTVQKKLGAMVDDLGHFALNAGNHASTRSFAGQCLHTTLTRFCNASPTCPVWSMITNTIMPTLRSSLRPPGDKRSSTAIAACVFADSLSVLAVAGSAAACRGGVSNKTANAVVTFLVSLACDQKACNPFSEGGTDMVDLAVFDASIETGTAATLFMVPASAFGSIMSTPSDRPLWKQRLLFIAVKQMDDCRKGPDHKTAANASSLGMVAVACHVVCSNSANTLSTKHLDLVTEVIAGSLAPDPLQKIVDEDDSLLKLLLASLVKLLTIHGTSFAPNIYFVITGTLRAFATASIQSAQSELASKLLALQILEAATHISGAHESLRTVKPAVVSVLANAMNHPSSLLRQAAVEVRNTWYLIE